jgi:hypothetical protein
LVFAAPVSDPFPVIYPPAVNPVLAVAPPQTNSAASTGLTSPTIEALAPVAGGGTGGSNGLAQAAGTYNGLVYNVTNVTVGTSGYFSAKTEANGSYSGSLTLGGTSHSISGKFSAKGVASSGIALATGQTLTVRLQLDLSGSDRLTGVISQGSVAYVAEVDADRLVWSAKGNPAPQQGDYTMAIPPGQGGPDGYGYGTVTVGSSGVVKWNLTLADGTTVGQSSAVSKHGLWGLYGPLYKGGGAVISWMQFDTNQPESDVSGQMVWVKPVSLSGYTLIPGYTNVVSAVGSAYVAPGSGSMLGATNLELILSGGGLEAPLTNVFSLNRLNQPTGPAGAKLSLNFTAATGVFKGSVWSGALNQALDFQGVVYEKGGSGAGLFVTAAAKGQTWQSGEVYLGAPPGEP